MRTTAAATLAALLLVAGCGVTEADDPASSGPAALTARAVAAVMLDHLPDGTTHRQATHVDEHSPKALVGAELSYHGDGEYDGDSVEVTVSRAKPSTCEADCADLGDGVVLAWDEVVPEEDPGIVSVYRHRGGETVAAVYAGPDITGDPRGLDLEISVDTLAGLVRDPRLRLETDAATVAAGETVEEWKGGEVDPASLERVRNDDATVVAGWIFAYGDAWRYAGSSPYKHLFGKDAIGGRVRVTGDMQIQRSGFLDALAAPQPPRWLEEDCLDGYRCDRVEGVQVVWRPAEGDDRGDAFLVHVHRNGETVAVHAEGNRMPGNATDAAYAAGLGLWSSDLTDRLSETPIALTTTRAKYERAAELAQRRSNGSE